MAKAKSTSFRRLWTGADRGRNVHAGRGFQRHRQPLEACRQAAAAVAVNQAQARRL